MTLILERLAEALLWLLSTLPLSALRKSGALVGGVLARLDSQMSRVAEINLELCFPDLTPSQRRELRVACIVQTAILAAELPFLWSARRNELWRTAITAVDGEHLIRRQSDTQQGLLILVPHIGNWEVLSLYLADLQVLAPFMPPRSALANRLLQSLRTVRGTRMVPLGIPAVRTLYRALSEGATVAMLPDQVPERSAGIYAPFFGRPALTMTLASRLALQTRAQVVLGACLRCEGGFRLEFHSLPGFPSQEGEASDALRINHAIEEVVRRFPEQYQWTYKRFKRAPEGFPELYDS